MRLSFSWLSWFPPARLPRYQTLDVEDGSEPRQPSPLSLRKHSRSLFILFTLLLGSIVCLIFVLLGLDAHWDRRFSSLLLPSPATNSNSTSRAQPRLHDQRRLAASLPTFLATHIDSPSTHWAPASMNSCPPGTPSYLAPCLARRREGAVYGEELLYPDFRIRVPLFAPNRTDDSPAWRRLLSAIAERAAFCGDGEWACYRGQTGQNIVLANATYRGSPAPDLWNDGACMGDGVTTEGLETASANATINTLADAEAYQDAFPLDTLLIATPPDSWSFQHFLDRVTHIVAQGHHFSLGQAAPDVVTGRAPGGSVAEMWELMGLGGGRVHHSARRLAAKTVIFSCRAPLVHPWLSLRSLELFGLDPAGVPIDRRKKVVYVSRSHGATSNGGRRVLNEDKMLDQVRALLVERGQGEELVLFHELDISPQPALMKWFHENVRAVVGPHGGGLYNHRWAGRDTLVLELMPRTKTSHMFWEEAGVLGQTYANVLLEPISNTSTDMDADIPAVLALLGAHLGKPDPRGSPIERQYRWHAPELLGDEQ
ncbi:hypothetical protein C2E23DRAFT_732108 [Lenzites betulinus]|nr:hypothetical protein C2E23DRAFT_732108 [Lenzites betulinus]